MPYGKSDNGSTYRNTLNSWPGKRDLMRFLRLLQEQNQEYEKKIRRREESDSCVGREVRFHIHVWHV